MLFGVTTAQGHDVPRENLWWNDIDLESL